MKAITIGNAVRRVSYPGCGMIAGKSADGLSAVFAYFSMGRSPISKNRLFIEEGNGVRIVPFIKEAMRNESLLVYSPVLAFENKIVMGNGLQTDYMYEALLAGKSFEDAIAVCGYTPDAPHFTPRITALASMDGVGFKLKMSLIKSMDHVGAGTGRFIFDYDNLPNGVGYYLHTYDCDANPLPAFQGEPIQVSVNGSIFDIVADIWENLNAENKVSLWVRVVDLSTHRSMSRIINKNR